MRDVSRQLADYFDATVERITADDVFIAASVSQPTPAAPVKEARLRPAWAFAVAFVTTLIVISGSLGAGLLLRAEQPPVGAGGVDPSPAAIETGIPWALIAVAITTTGVIIAVTLRHRFQMAIAGRDTGSRTGRNGRTPREGGRRMTMTDTPMMDTAQIDHLRSRNRTLTVAVIVLAVLAIGLGAWAVYQATASDDAGPAEVLAITDDWFAANEAADGSVVELYHWNGYHQYGIQQFRGDEIAAHLSTANSSRPEWIGDPVLLVDSGEGRWVVARPMRIPYGGQNYESIISFEVIRGADGELLLAQTEWLYDHSGWARPAG